MPPSLNVPHGELAFQILLAAPEKTFVVVVIL
jgi:hypothetical protein